MSEKFTSAERKFLMSSDEIREAAKKVDPEILGEDLTPAELAALWAQQGIVFPETEDDFVSFCNAPVEFLKKKRQDFLESEFSKDDSAGALMHLWPELQEIFRKVGTQDSSGEQHQDLLALHINEAEYLLDKVDKRFLDFIKKSGFTQTEVSFFFTDLFGKEKESSKKMRINSILKIVGDVYAEDI